jgi:hypothetical protein
MDNDKRIVKQAKETGSVCPHCKRITHGWPLKRPDKCAPKDWAYCIRNL